MLIADKPVKKSTGQSHCNRRVNSIESARNAQIVGIFHQSARFPSEVTLNQHVHSVLKLNQQVFRTIRRDRFTQRWRLDSPALQNPRQQSGVRIRIHPFVSLTSLHLACPQLSQ
ncbi:hypothetical protein [Burkholderia ubonensis]|uniref:hypothetical protein n=1 Tax=Burkholderia ubonensis TaxID=101571 RepID=UPI0012FB4F4A|nr:hypothetical protein [Burkholderia ubonensis]